MSEADELAKLKEQMAEMQATIGAQNEELERVRAHSKKLLDEKKKLQTDYKAFESLGDIEAIQNMLKQFQNDEDAKLFAEGRGADVLKKHTERLTLDFQGKIDDLLKENESLKTENGKLANKFHDSEAGHAISSAALKAGVRDTALGDILMRGRGIFRVADDDTLEARDAEGHLRLAANGKPLTPDLFVEDLREKYPHYWPDSKSSGARGGAGGDNTPNPFVKGENYNLTEQAKLRKSNPELADRMAQEASAGSAR